MEEQTIIRPVWADTVPGEIVERSWANGALCLHPQHPMRERYYRVRYVIAHVRSK